MCFQHSERSGSDRPICDYRLLAHFGQIEENAGMTQPGEELLPRGRKVGSHRVSHLVHRHTLHDARHTEAMIAMEVGEAQAWSPHLPAHRPAGVAVQPAWR